MVPPMASLTLKLRVDPATGKKDVLIDYHGDAGALPLEHEQEHRRLVEKLLEAGVLKAGEVGRIIVEREAEPAATAPVPTTPEAQREAAPQKG